MMGLPEELGFFVKDGQMKTFETRKDQFDNVVSRGIRPATPQEVAMYEMLVELSKLV